MNSHWKHTPMIFQWTIRALKCYHWWLVCFVNALERCWTYRRRQKKEAWTSIFLQDYWKYHSSYSSTVTDEGSNVPKMISAKHELLRHGEIHEWNLVEFTGGPLKLFFWNSPLMSAVFVLKEPCLPTGSRKKLWKNWYQTPVEVSGVCLRVTSLAVVCSTKCSIEQCRDMVMVRDE